MVTGDGVGVDVGVDEFFLREKARAREKRPQKSPRYFPGKFRGCPAPKKNIQAAKAVIRAYWCTFHR